MKKALSVLVCILFAAISSAQSVKWHYNLHDVSFGQTSAKDVDGDGNLELIFSTYWNDSNVYCLNAEDGTLKWKHHQPGPVAGCNDAGPLIFDPLGNGNYKVVIPGSCMDTTFCVDADSGYVQWKTITGGGDSPPSTADIDGDGDLDVLHGNFYGDIYCLDGKTGTVNWILPADPNTNANIESEVSIVDADNNGTLELVAGTYDLTYYNSTTLRYDSNFIAAYTGQTHSLIWKVPMKDLVYHGPAFGDIDRDGKMEIVGGDYSGELVCIKADNGNVLWRDSVSTASGGYIGSPVTLADLDNDGYLDIIYTDGNMVRAVNRNDSTLWTYSPPGDYTSFRGVVVADVNNDSIKDVTFATDFGKVISLDGVTGSVIRSFDLAAYSGMSNFEIDNAPIISDFDHDGILDLFIIGGYGTSDTDSYLDYGIAYCLSWGVGKGPDWDMFRHDERRSGCVCAPNGLPEKIASIPAKKATEVMVSPNPSTGTFNITCSLNDRGNIKVTITDITGRPVLVTERSYPAGTNTICFSREQTVSMQDGIYFVQVTAGYINSKQRLIVTRQ